MKWLFVLLLALAIFGSAAWFGYNTFVKEEIEVKKEQRGEVTPPPVVDVSLPEFQAAVKLRQDGKLAEARDALMALIQRYPTGKHLDDARDLLGEVNVAILLSRYPSPEKIEYIVKPGDVLAKIARKLKTTPELIMRMNNMSGTMLRIGDRLLISHPDLSMVIQRKSNLIVLSNHASFSSNITSARQSCRRNHPLRSQQKLPKRWHGKGVNVLASAARSTSLAQSGSGSPARQHTRCIRCRIQRTPTLSNRLHRRASVSPPRIWRS